MLDRSTYIGSHDIAAIIPDGKGGYRQYETAYTTPYKVWAAKRGVGVPFKKTFTTERGLALEPVILEWWWKKQKLYDRERYKLCIAWGQVSERAEALESCGVHMGDTSGKYCGIHLRSKSHPHCGASPDALVYDTQEKCFVAGVDAKSVNAKGWEKYESRSEMGVPQNLMIQGYYFMAVSGLPVWHFAVLEMAWDEIHEFTLERTETCTNLLTCAEHFWETYIATGKEPPTAGTKYTDFAKIHRNRHGMGDGEADPTAEDWALREAILAEEAERKASEERIEALKIELRGRMGEAGAIKGVCKLNKRGAMLLDRKGT